MPDKLVSYKLLHVSGKVCVWWDKKQNGVYSIYIVIFETIASEKVIRNYVPSLFILCILVNQAAWLVTASRRPPRAPICAGKPVLVSFLASHGELLYLNPKTAQRISPMVKKK